MFPCVDDICLQVSMLPDSRPSMPCSTVALFCQPAWMWQPLELEPNKRNRPSMHLPFKWRGNRCICLFGVWHRGCRHLKSCNHCNDVFELCNCIQIRYREVHMSHCYWYSLHTTHFCQHFTGRAQTIFHINMQYKFISLVSYKYTINFCVYPSVHIRDPIVFHRCVTRSDKNPCQSVTRSDIIRGSQCFVD